MKVKRKTKERGSNVAKPLIKRLFFDCFFRSSGGRNDKNPGSLVSRLLNRTWGRDPIVPSPPHPIPWTPVHSFRLRGQSQIWKWPADRTPAFPSSLMAHQGDNHSEAFSQLERTPSFLRRSAAGEKRRWQKIGKSNAIKGVFLLTSIASTATGSVCCFSNFRVKHTGRK